MPTNSIEYSPPSRKCKNCNIRCDLKNGKYCSVECEKIWKKFGHVRGKPSIKTGAKGKRGHSGYAHAVQLTYCGKYG